MKITRTLGVLVVVLGMTATACSNRKGGSIKPGKHSTYPHHYHDSDGDPHHRHGHPPPPPHKHRHGPTWKK